MQGKRLFLLEILKHLTSNFALNTLNFFQPALLEKLSIFEQIFRKILRAEHGYIR